MPLIACDPSRNPHLSASVDTFVRERHAQMAASCPDALTLVVPGTALFIGDVITTSIWGEGVHINLCVNPTALALCALQAAARRGVEAQVGFGRIDDPWIGIVLVCDADGHVIIRAFDRRYATQVAWTLDGAQSDAFNRWAERRATTHAPTVDVDDLTVLGACAELLSDRTPGRPDAPVIYPSVAQVAARSGLPETQVADRARALAGARALHAVDDPADHEDRPVFSDLSRTRLVLDELGWMLLRRSGKTIVCDAAPALVAEADDVELAGPRVAAVAVICDDERDVVLVALEADEDRACAIDRALDDLHAAGQGGWELDVDVPVRVASISA